MSIFGFDPKDSGSTPDSPVSSRSLIAVISGSQPEDARSNRVGSMPQYPIGKGGRFESEQVGNGEWDRHLPVAEKADFGILEAKFVGFSQIWCLKYIFCNFAACPGGEEAVLKIVGQKWLACSNHVRCVIANDVLRWDGSLQNCF